MRMGQICLQHQMILSIYIYLHREENQSLAKYLKNTYIPVAYVRRWLCVAAPPPPLSRYTTRKVSLLSCLIHPK